MLEYFVKWMASLPEFERDQKMELLMSLFAPSPSHEDFKRLKGALMRRDKYIKQLESELCKAPQRTFEEIFTNISHCPDYQNIRKRIVAAKLYKNLAQQNKALLHRNNQLKFENCKLHRELALLKGK